MSKSNRTMSRSDGNRMAHWSVPALGVAGGIAYLVAAWISGKPGLGLALLAIMVAFSAAVVILGRRSETVRGLLDRRDERIVNIDLRATAASGTAVILAVVVGAVVELGRGHSGAPYTWLAAVAGLVYLGAVVVQRIRG
jgi:hypothetical protein